jgi:hypothetical protein
MIRSTIVFLLFVFGIFFAGLYAAYDEIDPCRALAVENARRSPLPTAIAEAWNKIGTSHQNRLSCTRSLILSWRERAMP